MKKISMTIFLGGIAIGLYGCSSATNQYSPDQVIQNALEEATPAYYGEVEFIMNDQGKETREILREWRNKDGKTRIESQHQDGSNQTISVNDGSALTLYEVDQNKVYMIDDVEISSLNQPSPRDQVNMLLELIRDTHKLSTNEGEEVVGRDTYHIFAKANQSNTLFGDVELWIDNETWLIVKMILHTGDSETTMTYTTIDFDYKMSPDLFTVDLPEDVEVENLTGMLEPLEISLEDVPTKIGRSVVYFPETDELKISLIELYELQGEINRNEVSFNYTKNGLPLLTLSIFETADDMADDIVGEMINIRNYEGAYSALGELRSILWNEDGMTYSILLIDPNLTVEEVIQMAEEMVVIQ